MKWSDISFGENGEIEFIESNNLKVNRLKNRFKTDKERFIYIPICNELKDLLLELGLMENIGSSRHTGEKVLKDHYLDEAELARDRSKFGYSLYD